ncbi:peptidylprolyl isomerase [Alteromonas halophila]|uniref:Peptidyl-prolyl cis-trans isomerase n=1 Tax=Alteromonas halophila TaxID=516698 RepID=A0A918MXV9_9ALTE|nr:peptidylprolyl isomerase [Alteromonas halophila]GGW80273.1 peptidyl-prolyl cis-trans isomerase [Alteromonas halophila]
MLRIMLLTLLLTLTASVSAKNKKDGADIQPDNYYPRVKLTTTMGEIVVELYRRRAPITVNNFLTYVDTGSYNNTIFHRVVPGFVVQGGGYNTDLEEKVSFGEIFNESGNGLKNTLYSIAMARQNDPHTATRQFFFNLNDNTSLDPGKDWGYTVFGTILEGEDVIEAISEVETEYEITLNAPHAPKESVILKKAEILPPL